MTIDTIVISIGNPVLFRGMSETGEFSFESLEKDPEGYLANQLEFFSKEISAMDEYKANLVASNPMMIMEYFDSNRSFQFGAKGRFFTFLKVAFENRTFHPKDVIRERTRKSYLIFQANCRYFQWAENFFSGVENFFQEAYEKFPEDDILKEKTRLCVDASNSVKQLYNNLYFLSRRGMNISVALYEAQLQEHFRLPG